MLDIIVNTSFMKKGGYKNKLELIKPDLFENDITIAELDLENEDTLDGILKDIISEMQEGTIYVKTRYKGKNPKRWFSLLYPSILEPKFLGAFKEDDTLLGWMSLNRSIVKKSRINLGAIIKKEYRNRGLCSSMGLHVKENINIIMTKPPNIDEFFFATTEDNKRIVKIAKNMQLFSIKAPTDEIPNRLFFTNVKKTIEEFK
ncbi:MAG: hypothetical protein ACTSVI_06815 [Promethearchaeota archaeon]